MTNTGKWRDLEEIFQALERSAFRQRFKLTTKEQTYIQERGLDVVLSHGADFIAQRLAPARPSNDGRQTPMRGHPVFIAQHATATCCRSCLAKWHGIAAGSPLSASEQAHVLKAIERWLLHAAPI
ncbi:DUF4186 domain-containing protein [Terricaulis sp.]|uniref:DUF4186 domain-containing protein n=1 Tax=Terricaulis sp. TaxID=2768686 RepID=UPI002AC726C1|nr:DUF4186 domain-containing protein [Terricaulis sp.]MDZ4690289.1 DUF4186 domain-containing protein [Terricaulis sp.]